MGRDPRFLAGWWIVPVSVTGIAAWLALGYVLVAP